MIKPGTYTAKATQWGLKPSQNGGQQVMVEFTTTTNEKITWYGGMSNDKAKGYTFQNLITLGANLSHWTEFWMGSKGKAITPTEVEIVVENEKYKSKDGTMKESTKVKYINPLGGKAFKDAMTGGEAESILKGMIPDLMAKQKEMGLEKKVKNFAPGADSSDEIPF